MPLPFQPIRIRYGYKTGDSIHPIPSHDPAIGGNPLLVHFSEDLEDPKSHHSDAGGVSIVWGPNIGSSGALVDGTVSLWIRDLWAPAPDERTEFQIRLLKYKTADYSLVNMTAQMFSQEYYAPLHHDDLVWDSSGNVIPDAPGHRSCNAHVTFHWTAEEVKADECLRVAIAQYHGQRPDGSILVPGYDLPYPGHVWRAQGRLKVWPR
ncbi:hypothetical protein [Actinomadura rugatobispora]|uniref:Uncharacterized protein n=1 Tax=Actinomadura rugatobispora TaxID=1994 RepID=A0ABW0ZNP0_9ACTN|nr:hypothetical protein GCM10010200_036580 [Actinomadura rugatobispora]